jgi:GAF domain-containing protein
MTATVDNAVADLQRANTELQRQLDERTAERDEALEQQTATAEVLEVVNSSPADLAPVFDALLEKAMHLCQAAFGALWTHDGEYMHAVATRGVPSQMVEFLRQGPHRPARVVQRSIIDGAPYEQIADLRLTDGYPAGDPLLRAGADLGGVRTLLAVALRKNDKLLGVFGIYRQEVLPFTEKQIALLQNFAAQAVIAMENARLITETREALEQQTATAEVLGVINASPGDLAPVFEAMLEKATGLREAAFGTLRTYDDESFRSAASRGVPRPFADFLVDYQDRPDSASRLAPAHARILDGEPFVQFGDVPADLAATADRGQPRHPLRQAAVELGGARSLLVVPVLKENAVLGLFKFYRQEVRPFSDRQIALIQNFAAQADRDGECPAPR